MQYRLKEVPRGISKHLRKSLGSTSGMDNQQQEKAGVESSSREQSLEVINIDLEEVGEDEATALKRAGYADVEMALERSSTQIVSGIDEEFFTANNETPERETQDSEPGRAERFEAHVSNNNWKLLRDAYHSKKGNLFNWGDLVLESDIFNQKSPQDNTVLHIAARNGNDDLVEKIAGNESGSHLLTAKNSNGDTALHVAAKAGHFSTLERLVTALLCKAPSPNSENPPDPLEEILVENKQGNSFFHEALINGHVDVMDFLVSHDDFKEVAKKAAVQINKENKSVLYLAIESGHKNVKKVVDQILAELIPHDRTFVPKGKSPLLAAIATKNEVILKNILTKKPEWIHLRDTDERSTPLHYAASIGFLNGVECLLGKCASWAMERDKHGFFPLHLASYAGHVKVVQELLKPEYCPDPSEMLDKDGRNILHLAVESGKFNVVRHILQAPNNELEKMINAQNANGNTPLHFATLHCYPKIVHALTWDKRVDLTLVNGEGKTAFDVFDRSDNPPLQRRLTWIAIKSAGVRSREPSSIKVPPKSRKSFLEQKAPNMDPFKDRINTLILVSTLIITVTFAAGFTIPGGTNSSDPGQGMALMLNRIWFKLFIFCITISMYGAISVTIILFWAQLGDITLTLLALKLAMPLLGITLATLSVAFLAGVHLVISDLSWLATSSLVMGLVFIFILLLLYTLLLFPSSSSNPVVRYISYYPFLLLASLVEPDGIIPRIIVQPPTPPLPGPFFPTTIGPPPDHHHHGRTLQTPANHHHHGHSVRPPTSLVKSWRPLAISDELNLSFLSGTSSTEPYYNCSLPHPTSHNHPHLMRPTASYNRRGGVAAGHPRLASPTRSTNIAPATCKSIAKPPRATAVPLWPNSPNSNEPPPPRSFCSATNHHHGSGTQQVLYLQPQSLKH